MPSLDYIYDITEKLDEENLNYLVLTIREGQKEDKVDVFFNIKPQCEEVFERSIQQVKEILVSRNDDGNKPIKPKRKRRRKK
tara:strand:+ start:8967 stop:9212 length:246 start_codon:yes stop_codon:yes gene_type:complete